MLPARKAPTTTPRAASSRPARGPWSPPPTPSSWACTPSWACARGSSGPWPCSTSTCCPTGSSWHGSTSSRTSITTGRRTWKLGALAMLNLYVLPYWIFVAWLDFVTYLHHHGAEDGERVPWYRGEEWSYLRGGLSTLDH